MSHCDICIWILHMGVMQVFMWVAYPSCVINVTDIHKRLSGGKQG